MCYKWCNSSIINEKTTLTGCIYDSRFTLDAFALGFGGRVTVYEYLVVSHCSGKDEKRKFYSELEAQ
ncbi:hypothetical protein BTZ05_25855 [Vibrio parahaemolyticus]|nr:hypothetical protein BTZ05_25855 [Vibrio parahaemolyticus]